MDGMKRFIFLSILFMMCLVAQAQMLKPMKVQIEKKATNVFSVGRPHPGKSGPLNKKIITNHISLPASELKQRKQ